MAENKRGRGRPKKEEQIVLTKDQKIAMLKMMLATSKVLNRYRNLMHPSYDQLVNLDDASIKMFDAFPFLLQEPEE